jgi:uncharacterized protein
VSVFKNKIKIEDYMSLQEKINKELAAAMKSGDKLRLETLRSIRAQIIEFNKRGLNREITEEEEVSILSSSAKQRKESIEEFRKGNRPELAEKEEKELNIISEFLPKQLSIEEVKNIIQKIISETNAESMKDFGKVMPLVMKELKGKADGKLIQETVKEFLSK